MWNERSSGHKQEPDQKGRMHVGTYGEGCSEGPPALRAGGNETHAAFHFGFFRLTQLTQGTWQMT